MTFAERAVHPKERMPSLYVNSNTVNVAAVDIVPYTARMSMATRSAYIQARVVPAVKEASERVLWRIGLNMSEAMELFLRRIIIDEKLPFEVVALKEEILPAGEERGIITAATTGTYRSGGSRKKNSKSF